jgi:hypothetical protein
MRLLAIRAETMQGIRRLKLPCDDITPLGLWGSDMFLIGVNNDQFEVLRTWNVQTEDVTPAALREFHTEAPAIPTFPSAGNTASGARPSAIGVSTATPPQRAAGTPTPPMPAASVPAAPAPAAASAAPAPAATKAPPAKGAAAAPAVELAANGAVAPERQAPALTLEKGAPAKGRSEADIKTTDTKESSANAGKLRMTVDGEHLYAEIKGGKIQLKDRTYDSLAHARDSIRRERNKVAVWEYFDEGVKAWRVLNRD